MGTSTRTPQGDARIHEELNDVRADLADSVSALAWKLDVPARASDRMRDARASAKRKASDNAKMMLGVALVSGAALVTLQVQRKRRAQRKAEQNRMRGVAQLFASIRELRTPRVERKRSGLLRRRSGRPHVTLR